MNEFYDPAYPLGYKPGSVPPWYTQVGNHWESPSTETLVGRLGNQFFVTDPRGGGLYSYGFTPDENVYIEGLGWRPRSQGSLMYSDSPQGRMYSALSGFPWIDRTPKPSRTLTQEDANAWLKKVGASSLGTMANAYSALPAYNTPTSPTATTTTPMTASRTMPSSPFRPQGFTRERDYQPFPLYNRIRPFRQ